MILNTPQDVASWVLKAPYNAVNETIRVQATGALPVTFGAFVRLLDREGYIRAFWCKSQGEWTWRLIRTKRRALRNQMVEMMAGALMEAQERKEEDLSDD